MTITPDLIKQFNEATDFDEFDLPVVFEVLVHACDMYENDDPVFSDETYNALEQFARTADPRNDFFMTVGSDVRGGKIPLDYPMGSLTQIYHQSEFETWVAKHALTTTTKYTWTEKLDGMSGSLHFFQTGQLRQAFSRGNGTEGADITRHLKQLVKSSPDFAGLEIRCEIIISKANFEIARTKVFRKGNKPYKNARNMISGLMNGSELDPLVIPYIDVVVYHDWNEPVMNKASLLRKFSEIGFKIPRFGTIETADLTDANLTELLNKVRDSSQYDIDGLVIEVDDHQLRQKMNPSKATLNPEYARKYKVADASNNAIATVDFVEWRVSKRGYVKPRVHFIPFPLCGVTVTHATGFNADFIVTNGIAAGAKVHVTRSGDVIPFITGVAERSPLTKEEIEEQITEIGEWKWSEEHVDAVLTEDHESIGLKLAESFFTDMGVEGLKAGNLKMMFGAGFNTPEKIINASLDHLAFAINSMSNATGIYESLHKQLKSKTLPHFMGATGLFGRGVGKRKIQALYDVLGKDVLNFHLPEIHNQAIAGFDVKTKNKVVNGLAAYKSFYDSVKDHVEFVEPRVVEGGKLNGQVFLFTGFRNKNLGTRLEDQGGVVADSFSKKVTCVIAADPDEKTGKVQKANLAGIKVIGLGEVEDLFA